MCEIMTTQELLSRIQTIDRKEQYAEQNYAIFDIAFHALMIALIAIVGRIVNITPILYKCFEIVAEKFM